MTDMQVIEGDLRVDGARFGIVTARFNGFIVDALLAGARDALVRHGADAADITVARVPGAFELPLVARRMARRDDIDAVIALGAIIRGSTPHFDYVAGEAAKGLGQVSLEHDVPVIFGVLTTESIEQAIERAGTKAGNKGADAAMSAIEMVNLLRSMDA